MNNYIHADRLLAEIESRMGDCKLPNGNFPTPTSVVRYEELSCLRNFVASLKQGQPPLPHNVDEAAKEHTRYYIPFDQCDSRDIIRTFKAGAEWMARQGLTVDGTFHHSSGYPSVIELKTFLRDYEGADVIVNIRKKQ